MRGLLRLAPLRGRRDFISATAGSHGALLQGAAHEHVQLEQDVERVLLSSYGSPLACIYICSGSARLSESGCESSQATLVRGQRISVAYANSGDGQDVFSEDLP